MQKLILLSLITTSIALGMAGKQVLNKPKAILKNYAGTTKNNIAFNPEGSTLFYPSILRFEFPHAHTKHLIQSVHIPFARTKKLTVETGTPYRTEILATLAEETKGASTITCSPDGAHLAAASDDGTIRLFSATQDAPEHYPELSGHTDFYNTATFNPNGTLLAAISSAGTVRIWSITDRGDQGENCTELAGEKVGLTHALAFSPDGTTLASASDDRIVRLWPLKNTKKQQQTQCVTLKADNSGASIRTLTFDHDGSLLAAALSDGMIYIWTKSQGKLQEDRYTILQNHTDCVHALVFSPDGTTLASASHDGTICLWPVIETPESSSSQAESSGSAQLDTQETPTCFICLRKNTKKKPTQKIPCGSFDENNTWIRHAGDVHEQCWQRWLKSNPQHRCPICREIITLDKK